MKTRRIHFALAAVSIVAFFPAALSAHHGATGVYNFSRPYYVEGVVAMVEYSYPHAEIMVVPNLDKSKWTLPDFKALEVAEGRDTSALIAPIPATPGPHAELSFDGTLTREIIDNKQRPKVGDTVRAVVYRRDSRDRYMGEFRIMMIVLPDNQQLILGKRAYFRELN
jgi:hypothetical protein